jgi:type II secretory pathway pseudopilin PulG
MTKELGAAAIDVARNLQAFGSYGSSRRVALRALRRRQPNHTHNQLETALTEALRLFDNIRHEVSTYAGSSRSPSVDDPQMRDVGQQLAAQFSGFDSTEVSLLAAWVLYHYHLR